MLVTLLLFLNANMNGFYPPFGWFALGAFISLGELIYLAREREEQLRTIRSAGCASFASSKGRLARRSGHSAVLHSRGYGAVPDGRFEQFNPRLYTPKATTNFDCDIVYSNGTFIQYPEGVQQQLP